MRTAIAFIFILSIIIRLSVESLAAAKRTAIAHFDVVPYQVISKPFEVGVLAFHKNTIEAVIFNISDGASEESLRIETPSFNPRTNVIEYWVSIDPSLFKDGLITINAKVIPAGDKQEAEIRNISLQLYANANGTFDNEQELFVSLKGNDKNQGTPDAPLASIISALYRLKNADRGRITLLDEGTYYLGSANKKRSPLKSTHWITIAPAPWLNRDNVIITNRERSLIRLYSRMLHWQNLSFDFKNIKQIYNDSPYYWFEHCRWFSSDGREKVPKPLLPNLRNYYYATDSILHDMVYGFHFCKLLRNSKILNISGDAIQKNLLTVNTFIDNVGGELLKHHSDIYQMWDEMDNVILYNVEAVNLTKTQAIFLQPVNDIPKNEPVVSMSNSAFVNCSFLHNVKPGPGNNTGGPPFSQMQSSFEHILFTNVSLPWQHFVFRTDMTGNRSWHAKDVIFQNCELHYLTYKKYINTKSSRYIGPVPGVSFQNCRAAPIMKKNRREQSNK